MNCSTDVAKILKVQCCIAGGGPAGMMLGLLLARAGIEVVVLEKHKDFLRDFRGDTIHPSTLEIMYELGMLDGLLELPHQEVRHLKVRIGDTTVTTHDFTHLPTHCKFLVFMPQWDFLNFLAAQAGRYSTFHLQMEAVVAELLTDNGRTLGMRASTPKGILEVRSDLVIAADGRHSTVRQCAGLDIVDLGVPIDVLWMRLSRRPADPAQGFGIVDHGKMLAMIDRGAYYQCGFFIRKGAFDEIQQLGLPAFRDGLAMLVPFMSDRVREIQDWRDVHLLTVRIDRLPQWFRPNLLFIGDAAHAMSPIGGVGINLAIQDAVAAANILAEPLRRSTVRTEHLEAVQRRRELPTRITQKFQVTIQDKVVGKVLDGKTRPAPPLVARLLDRWPVLRRIPAHMVGIGFRPEHVRTPDRGPTGFRS